MVIVGAEVLFGTSDGWVYSYDLKVFSHIITTIISVNNHFCSPSPKAKILLKIADVKENSNNPLTKMVMLYAGGNWVWVAWGSKVKILNIQVSCFSPIVTCSMLLLPIISAIIHLNIIDKVFHTHSVE